MIIARSIAAGINALLTEEWSGDLDTLEQACEDLSKTFPTYWFFYDWASQQVRVQERASHTNVGKQDEVPR